MKRLSVIKPNSLSPSVVGSSWTMVPDSQLKVLSHNNSMIIYNFAEAWCPNNTLTWILSCLIKTIFEVQSYVWPKILRTRKRNEKHGCCTIPNLYVMVNPRINLWALLVPVWIRSNDSLVVICKRIDKWCVSLLDFLLKFFKSLWAILVKLNQWRSFRLLSSCVW